MTSAVPTHAYFLRAAVHIFLFRGSETLLLRRFNTGFGDGQYSVVAGRLDGSESVVSAAVREAKEEAGITVAPEDLRVVGVMHRQADMVGEWVDFFLVAARWQGEICNTEPDRCDELAWYPLDALPENMVPYVRLAFEQYQQGIWFTSNGFPDPT